MNIKFCIQTVDDYYSYSAVHVVIFSRMSHICSASLTKSKACSVSGLQLTYVADESRSSGDIKFN